jgi:hypothetical protein
VNYIIIGSIIVGIFIIIGFMSSTVQNIDTTNFVRRTGDTMTGNLNILADLNVSNDIHVGNDLWVDGDILLRGQVLVFHDLETNGSFVPTVTNAFDLGNSTNKWRNVYVSQWVNSTNFNGTYYGNGSLLSGLPTGFDKTNIAYRNESNNFTTGNLEITSNSASTEFITTYSSSGSSSFIGRRARGSDSLPTSVLANDILMNFGGRGFSTSSFASASSGVMRIVASENFNDTSQGSYLRFDTTANGTVGASERVRINSNGYVGIGTTSPSYLLDVNGDMTSHGDIRLSKDAGRFYITGSATASSWPGFVLDYYGNGTYRKYFNVDNNNKFGIVNAVGSTYILEVSDVGVTTLSNLAGSGNAFVCVNSAGTLYRSAVACV